MLSFMFLAFALAYEKTGNAFAGAGACVTLVLLGSIVC